MITCTADSHAKDKAAFAPTLVYRDVQLDGDGLPALDLYDCELCGSTLGLAHDSKPTKEATMPPSGESPGAADAGRELGLPARHITRTKKRAVASAQNDVTARSLNLAEATRAAAARTDRLIAENLGASIARALGLVDFAPFSDADNREPRVVEARRRLCRALREMDWSIARIGRAVGRSTTNVYGLLRSQATALA